MARSTNPLILRGLHGHWRATTVVFITLISRDAFATDRYYGDQTVFSPDRHFRLEAKSPDNAKTADGKPAAFAKNFTYRLFDQTSGKELWSRKQRDNEGSPMMILVADDRWVIVWGAWNDVLGLKPDSGEVAFEFNVIRSFPEEERKRYVHDTTAGPMWSGYSVWRFVPVAGRPYFEIRAWWDRRLVVDLTTESLVIDEARIRDELDRSDRQFVVDTLAAGAEGQPPQPNAFGGGVASGVHAAALMAGRLKIRDAVPSLRKLETWNVIGGTTFGGWRKDGWPEGEINPLYRSDYSLRQAVQLSLRRLGECPAKHAGTQFYYERSRSGESEIVPVKSPFPDREKSVAELKSGMKPAEVLRLIGAPDFVSSRKHETPIVRWFSSWEYDMDAPDPFTLRIGWDENGLVTVIERLTPVAWKDGETRDKDVVW